MKKDFFVVSCEHGANRIPSAYCKLFEGHAALRRSHRGYDAGALGLARELAVALDASLVVATVSRLLVDLNRSPGHPRLFSEITRPAPLATRQKIVADYYLPYRMQVETRIAQAIADQHRVVHISCHSFTPELDGKPRNADIGLLYDPARSGEVQLSRRCNGAFKTRAPALKIRSNCPYAGNSDGLTTSMRRLFPAELYIGMELEINQRNVLQGPQQWQALRRTIIDSLCDALATR